MKEILALALLLLFLGGLLMVATTRKRRARGLGSGQTVAIDNRTLFSEQLKLSGRPDRIEREGEFFIPEEWKPSARRLYAGHRLQLGASFLIVEAEYGVRPPYGWVVIRDAERVKVENTESLRSEVLVITERIRAHRQNALWVSPTFRENPGMKRCRVMRREQKRPCRWHDKLVLA